MEITATAKFVHISPKKVRPWLANLRHRSAVESLAALKYARSKAGKLVYKLLHSAMANATNNYNFKADNLTIKSLAVDDGPRLKRYWLRSHGAADVRLKRMSHLKIVLEEIVATPINKPALPVAPSAKSKISPTSSASDKGAPISAEAKPTAANKSKLRGLGMRKIFTRTTNK